MRCSLACSTWARTTRDWAATCTAAAPYTARTAGTSATDRSILPRLPEPLFKALHTERRALTTIEQLADFAAAPGIDRAAFLQAATATSTDLKLRRAREQAMRWRVPGTPSVIVNGKYLVQAGQGGFQGMLEVIDFLVAQEMRGD